MKSIWLNLPVKSIQKSRAFYSSLGFRENPRHKKAAHVASFLIGEHDFVLMLFPEEVFNNYTLYPSSISQNKSEMLINIDAQSRDEVNTFAQTVEKAGGRVYQKPQEVEGWMYLFSFSDHDNHCWNMLYMNTEKMPLQ